MTQNPKTSFIKIRKLIEQMDAISGLFLLKDSLEKFSKIEIFFKVTLPTLVFIDIFMVVSSLFTTNFVLISIIIGCSVFTTLIVFYITFIDFTRNKILIKNLLSWCENLYDIEGTFHEVVHQIVERRLVSIHNITYKVVRGTQIIIYNNSFMITVVFAIIGFFLPENIYPKFSPPVPFYLPFKNQETWTAFLTTVMVQICVGMHISIMGSYVMGLLYCVSIHILGYLDIIHDIIKKIKQDMIIELNRINDQQSSSNVQSTTIQSSVLNMINKDSVQKPPISFNQWISIVTDMINDVNSIITSLNKLFRGFFLQFEACNFGALFITGLVFTVVKQQYFFALMSLENILLYSICYINEQILEKLNNIKMAFYDLPWYAMDPKQRKMLILVMNCDKIQDGLTASKLHTMTIERFGLVIKAGYTNLLVLKDLVMK